MSPLLLPELAESSSLAESAPAGDEVQALADCSPERPLARRRLALRRCGVALGRLCARLRGRELEHESARPAGGTLLLCQVEQPSAAGAGALSQLCVAR